MRIKWVGYIARMGRREMHIGHGGKARKKRSLGRGRYECMDNINMDLRETGWIALVQDRDQWGVIANTVINLRAV
jgi:hypothetical protein